MQIEPLQEQLIAWIENHVPEKDLFFLREEDLKEFGEALLGTLVIPREELQYSSYNQIQWVNSYTYWRIASEFKFVVVAEPDWIMNLVPADKEVLFRIQYEAKRGLVFPLAYFPATSAIPNDHILIENGEKVVVIQKEMWQALPYSYQETAIKAYAQGFDSWISTEIPAELPIHLKKYANTFSVKPGANCLAAVLYAVSPQPQGQEWIVHEWLFQKTFVEGLKRVGYLPSAEKFEKGDVVAWVDDNDIIQHAAYCIDGELFFNKNGQTFFNPWKIVTWNELNKEWERHTPCVYRKDLRE